MKHILYFTAEWCNPCKIMKPIAEEINKDSAIKFKFIDVDENLDLCRSYNIKSVPTFILIKDKQEIKRAVGAKNKEELREFLNG